MAREIVSGNLNNLGNAGQFETDRSTWGFADSTSVCTRSSDQKTAGLYGAKVVKSSLSNSVFIPSGFMPVLGKKYLIKAKVFVPVANPIGPDAMIITLAGSLDNTLWGLTEIDRIDKTVLQAKGVWADIEIATECTSAPPSWGSGSAIHGSGSSATLNGVMYVDQFEIYEFVEVADPPPSCTIDLNEAGTIVTNASAPGANDGSIQGAVTGGTAPYEWSLNGGAWQASSLFSGLGAGNYTLSVREQGNPNCNDSHVFAVNDGSIGFDFTISITHESISGANDGSAVLTPSGTGGPFTYSKDGGANFQAGNSFTALAPGEYAFVVKNAAGNTLVKYGTVNAGPIDIEKVWHSKNPVILEKLAAVGWEALVNYRLYNDVRVEDVANSGIFNSKLKVDLHPDADGKAVFYLPEAFRDVFSLVTPNVNETSIVKLTDRIKRFKNFHGSIQDQEVTPATLTESLPSLVLWGGLSKEKFPDISYFTTYLATNKKFLTWAPVQKYVDRSQEDYLNFFVYGFFTSLKLRVKAYFDDTTNQTSTITTITGVKHYELYRIPAGPLNSGALNVNPAKNLIKYDLSLLNETDTVISEVRTYHVVRYKNPLTRHFMFLNSLGADEVLRFTGQATEGTGFQREILQKFLPHNYDPLDGEFAANEVTSQKRNSYSSGFFKGQLAEQWHRYMEDFLLSPRVYLVTDGQRLPVVVTAGDLNIEDQNHERFFRFEAKPAYDNVSYTPSDVE